jgi:arylsulfatase A-like enzyme
VLHLSYVNPPWPYLAPAPFHKLFRRKDIGPIRHGPQDGTADEHPVVRAYREHDECRSFARDDVVRHVRPAYMGLVAQVDYHVGRMLDALESMGRMRDTLIVFTSDHGEFSGDRGLGEKELLYDEIVRVPMIVMDPDPRADATRGTADVRFVEGIDVLPTIVAALDIPGSPHRVEGCSLLPLVRSDAIPAWRDAVFSELDYGFRRARTVLGRGVRDCRAFMVRTGEWKYVHWQGFRPQLFDLARDPLEQNDLGADPAFDAVRSRLRERVFDWLAASKRRTTVDDVLVEARTDAHRAHGVHIGIW